MNERLEKLLAMLELDPDDGFCLWAIAQEHHGAGRLDEAIQFYDRVKTVDPSQCYAWFHKARALQSLGMKQESIDELRQGLEAARTHQDQAAMGEIQEFLDELAGADA